MITFQEESFESVWGDVQVLLDLHWDEVGYSRLLGEKKINVEFYIAMEKAGHLAIFTARNDGALIGYASYMVFKAIHGEALCAESDAYFLLPQSRKSFTGYNMLKEAEQMLKLKGVQLISQKVKVDNDCGAIFKRLGYKKEEITYIKRV